MGRILVDLIVSNNRDVQMRQGHALDADQVRQAQVQGVIDSGSNYLILPAAVAKRLGVPEVGEAVIRYADGRSATRTMVEEVRVELFGRQATFRAIVEPDRTTALVGAIVLEDLDFLVDCGNQRIYPRDPERIIAEVE